MPSTRLKVGDVVLVEAGDTIPSDGEVIEGMASVNEAAITGKSAPVIRESGGDRSAVTGGTQVLSDWIRVRITAAPGSTFLDRMIRLVEGAERQKTPNEIALNILLAGMTLIFVFATASIPSFAHYAGGSDFGRRGGGTVRDARSRRPSARSCRRSALPAWTGSSASTCWPCRAAPSRRQATSIHLLLDKTGTITLGNRQATEFRPLSGVSEQELGRCRAARLACRRDAGRPLDRRAGEGETRHPRAATSPRLGASSSRSRRRPA